MIDINTLTLGEVAKIEDLSGQPITAFTDDTRPKGLALAAFAFVVRKRTDPGYKWNDALGLSLPEAQQILGITDTEAEPAADTDAEGDESPAPKGKRSKS